MGKRKKKNFPCQFHIRVHWQAQKVAKWIMNATCPGSEENISKAETSMMIEVLFFPPFLFISTLLSLFSFRTRTKAHRKNQNTNHFSWGDSVANKTCTVLSALFLLQKEGREVSPPDKHRWWNWENLSHKHYEITFSVSYIFVSINATRREKKTADRKPGKYCFDEEKGLTIG